MRIDVRELLGESVGTRVGVEFDLGFQYLSADVDVSSIKGTLNLVRTTKGIWVQGSLTVDVDLQCVRCLVPVTKALLVEIEERFQLPPIDVSDEEQPLPIDDDYHIDLAPVLRELVIVSMPMRVLCRADCKGLCSHCGKNLDEGPCDCETDDIDPRMAALKALLT